MAATMAFRNGYLRIKNSLPIVLTRIGRIAKRGLRLAIRLLGVIALIMIVLAFTRIPFDAHRALAGPSRVAGQQHDLIVILGGSGMPSGPELLRLHHGALEASTDLRSRVVVVHPQDTAVIEDMIAELILKGVDPARIEHVMQGTSTREQALHVAAAYPDRSLRIALVTAPENIYRSVKAFRKAGFELVTGIPAFDHAMFVDLRYDHRKIGGSRAVPDVSENLDLRYNFWNYLKLEITCLREYVAIAYYKLNGWI